MIRLVKGSKEHLDDCKEALINSDLGAIYFNNEDKAIRGITEFIETEKLFVALAKDDVCVGFMGYIHNGAFHSYPYLHIIAIKEKYRNQGIGHEMMEQFEEMVFQYTTKVFLVVADFNPKAKAFYQRLGYKEVGAIPDLYKEGVTEYLMMKKKTGVVGRGD